ncbi:hypothetical protein JCM30237_25620 [Halolamina litorea]|uniref:ParB/Sulfiredoxin domain-containing protein n=1 Tax=Halolamina litorea TaxID=1515593 RepID=A0ABD6BWQ8_9EURY|nr:hypothetical protein [Halolamina litorea]
MSGTNVGETLDDLFRGVGRRLLAERPGLEPYLRRARDGYARAYVGLRGLRNRACYAAPADPYRLIRIDPSNVERVVWLRESKFREAGLVVGGDWDRPTTRFTDLDVFQAYERHFEDGVPWEETAFFDRVVDEINDGAAPWGCESEAAFRERCDRLDDLYERIAEVGYRTQAELAASGEEDPIKRQDSLRTERLKDEIAVHVGRDGELLFADGRNRLSMVKLLGLESVPVRVLRRHTDWQGVRDAYCLGEPTVERFAGHPDLADLTFGGR